MHIESENLRRISLIGLHMARELRERTRLQSSSITGVQMDNNKKDAEFGSCAISHKRDTGLSCTNLLKASVIIQAGCTRFAHRRSRLLATAAGMWTEAQKRTRDALISFEAIGSHAAFATLSNETTPLTWEDIKLLPSSHVTASKYSVSRQHLSPKRAHHSEPFSGRAP